jgi:hypothetical protein
MAVVVVVGAMVGATLGVSALAQGSGKAESSVESTAPENSRADGDNVQFTAPGDADFGKAQAAVANRRHARRHAARHARHTRRVRHAQSSETTGESSESSAETEAGQPGEPANGHADAPGQNTDCTGNCVQ